MHILLWQVWLRIVLSLTQMSDGGRTQVLGKYDAKVPGAPPSLVPHDCSESYIVTSCVFCLSFFIYKIELIIFRS